MGEKNLHEEGKLTNQEKINPWLHGSEFTLSLGTYTDQMKMNSTVLIRLQTARETLIPVQAESEMKQNYEIPCTYFSSCMYVCTYVRCMYVCMNVFIV